MNAFKSSIIAALVAFSVFLSGCDDGAPPRADGDRPTVLATTTMIAEAARRVGGQCVQVRGLLPVGGDPHVYEPVPGDARAVAESDLVLYNGVGLEAWLDRLISNVGGERPIVVVSDGLEAVYGVYEGGRDPDPHLWGDVRRFSGYVENIRDALVSLVPECEYALGTETDRYLAELSALDSWARESVATIPEANRMLVTSHDAFQYYADAYGLEVLGSPIGISTDEQPSAQTVARIVDDVRRYQVPSLFVETTVNPNVIQRISRETGAGIGGELYSDSLGEEGSGAETYVGMIVHNTRTIVEGLGGEVQPFAYDAQPRAGR